jgi:hypothetical protein
MILLKLILVMLIRVFRRIKIDEEESSVSETSETIFVDETSLNDSDSNFAR